LAWAWEH
jgi:ABC-type uncharacterized transport system substrate-binding protein